MNKNSLIIVESPFQLLCAYEAIFFFNLNYKLIIRLSDNKIGNEQMKNITKSLNLKDIDYLTLTSKRSFTNTLKIIMFYIKFILNKYDQFIIGDYLSGFLRTFIMLINKKKVILLDDGVATFKIQRDLKEKNLPLSLFTIFEVSNFSNQKIFRNEFIFLKQKYILKNNMNVDIFIGGKLVDLNIISIDRYINILEYTIDNMESDKLLYFPHRGTLKKTLKIISKIDKLEIVNMNSTIEFFLLKSGINPNAIYSVLSTALFSLSIIYEKSKIISFKPVFLKNERESDIIELYKIISKNKLIKLKDID